MPFTREEKEAIVQQLGREVQQQAGMVFVDFHGLSNEEIEELRGQLRANDGLFRVAKKTMFRLAFQEYDSTLADVISEMEGQLAVVYAWSDPIATAKSVYEFSEEHDNLQIRGGYVEGAVQSAEAIVQYAQLPSAEELRARLVGSIANPLHEFVYVLNAPMAEFAQVLSAASEEKS